MKREDLTGKRYGEIEVICDSGLRQGNHYLWKCKCSCGRIMNVRDTILKTGKRTKCVHYIPENLVGKHFGRLTVESQCENFRKKEIQWVCLCDCGKRIKVTSHNLTKGNIESCGCYHSDISRICAKKMLEKQIVCGTNVLIISREKPKRNNTSGVTGVYFNNRKQKWYARLTFQGKAYNLGYFNRKEDAIISRKNAEDKYFKPFLEDVKNSNV